MRSLAPLALVAALGLAPLPAVAQETPNLMIVFDASGSMWGQLRGRAKIELAREALSSVLSEADPDMQIGMIAYGHRVRGQCSDIELVVPMGQAARTVPQMLAFAGRVNPRGMTPLTDSVLMAAQGMGYTEQSATVVLVTDGIETCAGDPCALGRMLAAEGIDFRAHVVGFDLTDAEQRQVSCLAEETGGMFLAANNADELRDALARTLTAEVMPPPEPMPEPEPVLAPRQVDLILRDVAGGPVLTGRPFRTVEIVPLDDGAPPSGRIDLSLNAPTQRTGRVDLLPGRYTLRLVRETQGRQVIRIALPVEIPEGADPHTVDLVIAARLQINALLHAGQPMPDRNGRLPRMDGQGWALFQIHPVADGAIDAATDYGGINSQDVALPPGDYFIRGTLSQMFTRERLVTVAPGVTTTVDFDFAAAPVAVDLRDSQGFAVDRVRVEIFDLDAADPFVSGRARDRTELVPAYLPEGTWRLTAREDRGGSAVTETFVTVVPGQPVTLTMTPGLRADPGVIPESALPLCHDTHRTHGCVIEAVTPASVAAFQGLPEPAPRYTGTWQTTGGMLALVQDGRQVWGEVHINEGIGLVWGRVGPDGLTLRGAMDSGSNPRGAMELRLLDEGARLAGRWDHNIGRLGSVVAARRISGGIPPLARATGTDDDLRIGRTGAPWAPADSPEFAAFMAPVMADADPNTGDDIDAMQRAAGLPNFGGVWNTNHQQLTLVQDGRRVWGSRRNGALWGEVSADGQTLRGGWISGRDWGLLEFRLDSARMTFEGAWGRLRDGGVNQRWEGTRVSWLSTDQAPVTLPAEATGPVWDAFMEPVRDPDPAAPTGPDGVDAPGDRTEAAPEVGIGTVTALPPGIWGMTRARSASELAQMLAQGATDPALTAEFAQSCAREPRVIHPDGLIAIRAFDAGLAAAGQAPWSTDWFLRCDQAGPILDCRGYNRPLATNPDPDDPDYTVTGTLAAGAGAVFALDEGDGNAMVFRSCLGPDGFLDAAERAPSGRLMIDHIADREDGGESPAFDAAGQVIGTRGQVAQAAPAPAPAPAPVPAPAPAPAAGAPQTIPPGLWTAEAPWSDPMPPSGTPAFVERCMDDLSATYPDGLTLGFMMQDTATGPEWEVSWSETCAPSGDATWPLHCTFEDGQVADVAAATGTNRIRVLGASAQRVEFLLLSPGETQPERFVLHSCLGAAGQGIDLTVDPRGQALVRALAEARPDQPLPTAAVTPAAPAPAAPIKPLPAAAGPDLRPALDGIWYPIRDGRRPAQLTDDEVAEACFETPGRFHPDGLMMLFRTRDGIPEPTEHLRCGPDLTCDFARGTPAESLPAQAQARLRPITEAEVEACLGGDCVTLGRCPAPAWSARERSSGLADRWETAVERRD